MQLSNIWIFHRIFMVVGILKHCVVISPIIGTRSCYIASLSIAHASRTHCWWIVSWLPLDRKPRRNTGSYRRNSCNQCYTAWIVPTHGERMFSEHLDNTMNIWQSYEALSLLWKDWGVGMTKAFKCVTPFSSRSEKNHRGHSSCSRSRTASCFPWSFRVCSRCRC